MSEYKAGNVSELFSTPKEPTTQAGKKLQSLFREFHGKKNPAFQGQRTPSDLNGERAMDNEITNQKTFKRNKKRKLSADEPEVKEKKNHLQKNNDKMMNSFEEKDFVPKRKKTSKLNSVNSGFNVPEINNSFEKEVKSSHVETLSKNSKGKGNLSFIKKSKSKTIKNNESFDKDHKKKFKVDDDREDELLKQEVKEFIQRNSKKTKKKKTVSNAMHNSQENSDEESLSAKNSLHNSRKNTGFVKKPKSKAFRDNESFDKKHKKKFRVAEEFDSDKDKEFIASNSKKSKKKNAAENNFQGNSEDESLIVQDSLHDSETNVDFKKASNQGNETTGFIRRPKNQSKNIKNNFEKSYDKNSEMPNKKSISENDNLFKTENTKQRIKKLKKNSAQKTKMAPAKEPHFVKLFEKTEDDKLSRTLFVGNLPINTTRKEFEKLFSQYGEIGLIRLKGIETDKAKIFGDKPSKSLIPNYAADSIPGFVEFKERASAVKALALCGTVFKNHHITVDFAIESGSKKIYDDKKTIFIGNLPFNTLDDDIWNAFESCGKIEGVRIVRDKVTGIGKGFGYVLFSTVKSKENALSLKDLKIEGRVIRIKSCNSNNPKQKSKVFPAKRDTFKSRAIRIKKYQKETNSHKSVKKLMKKAKTKHSKKKIASLLLKSMK